MDSASRATVRAKACAVWHEDTMKPLRFLFWNTGGTAPSEIIATLVRQHRIDVLILAEFGQTGALLQSLNSDGHAPYRLPENRSSRLTFVVAGPRDGLVCLFDGPGLAIRHYRPPVGQAILLVAVHLPSKLHFSDADQSQMATRIRLRLEECERQVGHRRTLLVGDLNMDPFEAGVVGSEGLHGVMDRATAARGQRVVSNETRHLFYNPMWSHLGDGSPGPPGSYYYASSRPLSYFWHTYDQVLLRPELAACFVQGDVAVLDRAGDQSLLTGFGCPDRAVSDHLPLRAIVRVKEFDDDAEQPVG